MTTFDAYTIYCQWQLDRGQPIPSRKWWAMACSRPKGARAQAITDTQWDVDNERREGWTK